MPILIKAVQLPNEMLGTSGLCLDAVPSSLSKRKTQPILYDLTYDIQLTDATTNLIVEEDLTLKDLVFDWRPALKEEHVLYDLRLLALAIDRKTKLFVFGLRCSARAIVKKAQLVVFGLRHSARAIDKKAQLVWFCEELFARTPTSFTIAFMNL
jgi:hypothetical protein